MVLLSQVGVNEQLIVLNSNNKTVLATALVLEAAPKLANSVLLNRISTRATNEIKNITVLGVKRFCNNKQ